MNNPFENKTDEEYFEKMKVNKEIPIKICWNEYARGFYCPTCMTGTSLDKKKCSYCGQLFLPSVILTGGKQ